MGRKKDKEQTTPEKGKKPFYKKWWFWLLIILIIGGIGAAGGSGGDSKEATTQTASETQSSAANEKTETKTYTADAESLTALFQDTFDFDYENLTVQQDKDGLWTVHYYPTNATWDNKSFIQENINWYITYCQKAYQIDGVDNVEFDVDTLFKDDKGNESVDNAMFMNMKKAEFDSFNWENLKYQPIYQQMDDYSATFWVHGALLKDVDTSKIDYNPSPNGVK